MVLQGQTKRDYQRQWIADRRASWLDGKSCVICGSTDRLEVDHIDRSTKVSHNVWSWSEERREQELAKCQVLCYTHHKEKTKAQAITEHGTIGRYTRGCGCELCLEANRARVRRQRMPS